MKHIVKSRLIIPWLFLLALSARAQTYSIDWDIIAGGGGTTTGGVYSVTSTVGQPVVGGSLAGGAFSLSSGFWALYSVATSSRPVLSILLSDTNTVVVAWPAGSTAWTLQQNTNLVSGTWIRLTNTVNVSGGNQVILSPPIGDRFYRLQSP